MKGDFSRRTFDPRKHYSAVLMQQGRVQLDADWNEQRAIDRHRIETETRDVVGPSGAPFEAAGFGITVTPDGKLVIGAGRYYVDGILCENDSDVTYGDQSHLPGSPDVPASIQAGETVGLVYLDVWRRHVTALDDPRIREVALGGPDTTTRVQTIWQVKILEAKPRQEKGTAPACGDDFPEWDDLLAGALGTGTLNARTRPVETPDGPCLIPPEAGYQRLENQLYRVEIHGAGGLGTATFKWSRDNGTVVTAIVGPIDGREVPVHDLGPDDVLGFGPGQWVEIADDQAELAGRPGGLFRIDHVDAGRRVVVLTSAPDPPDLGTHPKLRRWDTVASPGTLRVEQPAANDGWIALEGGIEVRFGAGTYTTGQYWLIPARTATGEIEWPPYDLPNANPQPQPALGIHHHISRLGLIYRDERTGELGVQDCRTIFPPLAARALHVVQTSWLNDADFSAARLLETGLTIWLDGPPEPRTVSPATMIVTLEGPQVGIVPEASPDVILILDGDIQVRDRVITWTPVGLTTLLLNQFVERGASLLRVTLKGHVIWREQGGRRLYLDGQAFGETSRVSESGAERTALIFPTGDGARASDFESWCRIGPRRSVSRPLQVTSVQAVTVEPDGESRPIKADPIALPPVPRDPAPIPSQEPINGFEITFNREVRPEPFSQGGRNLCVRVVREIGGVTGPVPLSAFDGSLTLLRPNVARYRLDADPLTRGRWFLVVIGDDVDQGRAVRAADDGSALDGDYDGQPGHHLVLPFEIRQ
jgi:hypothetical protein